MTVYLNTLARGDRFRLAGMPDVMGEFVSAGESSATVRIVGQARVVRIQDDSGRERSFVSQRGKTETWAPTTLVVPIHSVTQGEDTMTATKTKKSSKTSGSGDKATRIRREARKTAAQSPPELESAPVVDTATPVKKTRKAKADATAAPAKKMSALDTAAHVLASADEPMTAKALIDAMAAKGLWTSPGGKTPHATLYAAMLVEINKKGAASRFAKDGGAFRLAGRK